MGEDGAAEGHVVDWVEEVHEKLEGKKDLGFGQGFVHKTCTPK